MRIADYQNHIDRKKDIASWVLKFKERRTRDILGILKNARMKKIYANSEEDWERLDIECEAAREVLKDREHILNKKESKLLRQSLARKAQGKGKSKNK